MSQSASQAAAFRREILEQGEVWIVEDDKGVPAPESPEGHRALPFWSSRSRADRAVKSEQFAGCEPRRLSLAEFEEEWLADLERDGLLVGVNWTGPRFTGYDVEPQEVRDWLEALREEGGDR